MNWFKIFSFCVSETGSTNFTFFEIDRLEWLHRFERDTRKKVKHNKGIIQLNF